MRSASRTRAGLAALACLAAPPAARAAVEAPFGRYEVEAGPGARELAVEARFQPGAGAWLEFEEGRGAFVTAPQVWRGGRWQDAPLEGDRLPAPSCAREACRVRYTFMLDRAARAVNRHSVAFAHDPDQALMAPPSTWLIRPSREPEVTVRARPLASAAVEPAGARYHLRVRTPPGLRFVSGLFRVRGSDDTYAIKTLSMSPYSGFAPFAVSEVAAGGGTVTVAIGTGARPVSDAAVNAWVQRCAAAVAGYYARAPLPRYLVVVLTGGRRPVGYGTAMGHGGGAIMVWLGRQATERDLAQSWVLVHEMVHLGFPNVPPGQRWMEEGLATYVEPVARARAGMISEDELWRGMMEGLPKGLLQRGENGLNDSRRWGPLYWGGALFWLLADLEIRERTDNRYGLEHALRAVLEAGGSIDEWWPPERLLEVGDRAVGVDVLRGLYDRFGRAYMAVDLEEVSRRSAKLRGVIGAAGSGSTP